ncbi:MAG: two-component system response regulator, partial [Desulfamplus sp.]|nr:two-component system response regulator [Desulfamplus sp.]
HEKWDGSGYPNGLKGNKIPKIGQIVAVADVFDALTSKRPYKEPYSIEKSLDIIQEGSGNHFSPEVVKAFIAIKQEILNIKEKFHDKNESSLALS